MGWKTGILVGVMACVSLSFSAQAQTSVRHPLAGAQSAPKQEPCWQVAGISKATIEQRRQITQEARQQIEAVCANSALSPTQKREEIHQIRERERQQLESLITPSQQQALRACQEERGHGAAPHPGARHAEGPCGELLTQPAHPSTEGEENGKPPTEENPPH
jgi:Spy/CpxP family protein refolding chaperone